MNNGQPSYNLVNGNIFQAFYIPEMRTLVMILVNSKMVSSSGGQALEVNFLVFLSSLFKLYFSVQLYMQLTKFSCEYRITLLGPSPIKNVSRRY